MRATVDHFLRRKYTGNENVHCTVPDNKDRNKHSVKPCKRTAMLFINTGLKHSEISLLSL